VALESVSFDPNLADPNESNGRFDTSRPDVSFMREVVQDTIAGPPPSASAPATAASPTSAPSSASRSAGARAAAAEASASNRPEPTKGATSLSQTC
jgi:hypothetical protein